MNVHANVPSRFKRDDAPAPQRAKGRVFLSSKQRGSVSVIDDLAMAGSMKVLFPRAIANGLDAMLINTAGGVTGGDVFEVEARAGERSEMTVTSQACERGYRATGDKAGRLRTRLLVQEDARMNWLPQETILFDGAHFDRDLHIDLASSASLLMVEPVLFGRLAMGEEVRSGDFKDRVSIHRNGAPIYKDAVRLSGDIAEQLDHGAIGNGARAMAALVYVAPDAEMRLNALRSLLPSSGGASLLAPDILVARILASTGFELRRSLVPMIRLLNSDEIPRPWML
ncbi:MAG: urease accessory protein UreD [Maritimibacter sp.]